MISRRAALRIAGGAAVVTIGAGAIRAADQGLIFDFDRPGLHAWNDWNLGRYAGQLALVSAGVLAASPHNTQPWHFAVSRYGVDIFEVASRSLGAMDPFGRERLLGLGAAIHNMALATTAIGRAATVRLLPDPPNPAHVARVELGPEGQAASRLAPHPLVAAIGRRHTDRRTWRGGALANADIAALAAASRTPEVRVAIFAAGSPRGQRFAALTNDATAAIVGDAEMIAASHRWFRHTRRDQDAMMDGLGIATSGVSPLLNLAGAMLPAQTAASEGRYWLSGTRDSTLPTASAFGLVLVRDPWDRRNALLAGSVWERLHLMATLRDVAVQPLNQLVEMIDRDRQLGRRPAFAGRADALLDDAGWRPTFAFRLGHADGPAPASPRRPVSDVIGAPARLAYEVERAQAETNLKQGGR